VTSGAENTVGDIIKGLILDVALKAAISRAVAAIPFLALPIINPIFAYLMGVAAKYLYTEMERVVAFKIIDHKTEAEQKEYDAAAERLKNELQKPEQDRLAIDAAKEEMRKKLALLIRLNG
jgi:hypothetical protein